LYYDILLNRLQQIRIQGCVLNWFASYLMDQTFSGEQLFMYTSFIWGSTGLDPGSCLIFAYTCFCCMLFLPSIMYHTTATQMILSIMFLSTSIVLSPLASS